MKSKFVKFLSITDKEAPLVKRLLWAISVVAIILFAGYQLYSKGELDFSDLGVALATLLAGGGAALGVPSKPEEPPAE